jgi:FtsZ-binding cell division protein ZapB
MFQSIFSTCFIIFLNLVFLWNIKAFLDIFLTKKPHSVFSIISWMVFLVWQLYLSFFVMPSPNIIFIVNLFLIFLIGVNNYCDKTIKKIVIIMLYMSVVNIIECILMYIFIYANVDFQLPSTQLLASSVTTVSVSIAILCFKTLVKEKNMRKRLNDDKSLKILLIVNCCIFVLQLLIGNINPMEVKVPLYILHFTILIIQTIVFIIIDTYAEVFQLRDKESSLEQNLAMISERLEKINRENDNQRTINHDLKNHFLALYGQVNNLSSYLKVLVAECGFDESDKIADSDCLIVDTIINKKYLIARSEAIDFQVKLHILPQMPIEAPTLSIILGNALDNAIEAVRKLPADQRFIRITMWYGMHSDHHELEIVVENSCKEPLKRNKMGAIISSKQDADHHGIGLRSIEAEVRKYNGSYQPKYKEGVFSLTVKLYISDKKIINFLTRYEATNGPKEMISEEGGYQ